MEMESISHCYNWHGKLILSVNFSLAICVSTCTIGISNWRKEMIMGEKCCDSGCKKCSAKDCAKCEKCDCCCSCCACATSDKCDCSN
jgi:hypothetical protein